MGEALNHRGSVRIACGTADAYGDFVEAREQFLAADDLFGVARTLQNLSVLELKRGHVRNARVHIDEALSVRGRMRGPVIDLLNYSGLVALLEGDVTAAHDAFSELLIGARRSGTESLVAYALLGLGFCAHADGAERLAAIFHGAADARFEERGETLDSDLAQLRASDHRRIRRALDERDFALAYRTGRGLTSSEVVALALEA
ncbi:MAG TPA: hypothetical protein VN816_04935 [Acidimicrobiales bacterium]|nr:hypothetical protein [Acidimicrobiales bacterium]